MSVSKEKIAPLMNQIERNKYDSEAWLAVLRLILNDDVEKYRDTVYEKCLQVFPTSGKFWRSYIEHEVSEEIQFKSVLKF